MTAGDKSWNSKWGGQIMLHRKSEIWGEVWGISSSGIVK